MNEIWDEEAILSQSNSLFFIAALGFHVFCEFGITIQVPEWLGRRVVIAVDSQLGLQNHDEIGYLLCILFLFDMTNDVEEEVLDKAREILALGGSDKGFQWARVISGLDT